MGSLKNYLKIDRINLYRNYLHIAKVIKKLQWKYVDNFFFLRLI